MHRGEYGYDDDRLHGRDDEDATNEFIHGPVEDDDYDGVYDDGYDDEHAYGNAGELNGSQQQAIDERNASVVTATDGAGAADGGPSADGRKKRPRDYSDDFKPHRFAHRLESVVLPDKLTKVLLPDGRHASPGSAHRQCFTFFGYAERRTTHAVKKSKVVVVLMTYESIVLCDADRGELLRIIPVRQLVSPVYCVLEERVLHLKVEDEHDVVLQFVKESPQFISHPVDILCDRICDLHFLILEEELLPDEDPSTIRKLEVVEIPTTKQLVDVQLNRPPHVRYPAVRMKELVRYENPTEPEEEVRIPEEAAAQIPPLLVDIPNRSESFVSTLSKTRVEDLSKQLALLAAQRESKAQELDTLHQGNSMLRSEFQSLNMAVQSLRTAVQLAYKDAEDAQRKSDRRAARKLRQQRLLNRQSGHQMKWERGSDEAEVEDDFQRNDQDEDAGGLDTADEEEEEEQEADDDDEWENDDAAKQRAIDLNDKKALNAAVNRESRMIIRKLKVVRQKMMHAQEQASRLWTRTECASDFIQACQDALLRLEFIAQNAAVREAGATQSKPELEKINRALIVELRALKLLDQVSEGRDAELVKAETDVAIRKKVLADRAADEDKILEDTIRPQRIECERHLAEVTAFFESEVEKASARAAVEFHRMHANARSNAQKAQDLSVSERVRQAITMKVSAQTREAKYLRTELQSRASFASAALVSLRDENEGIKHMLNNFMKEYAMSQEAHGELRTRLLDAQRSLAEERELRKEILNRTKDQIMARTRETLRQKDEDITRTRKLLFELQDAIQRAAKTFGLGSAPGTSVRQQHASF